MTNVIAPTVHLNGTDGETLLRDFCRAHDAVDAAVKVLYGICPHDRDYYVSGVGLGQAARDQHRQRIASLELVKKELALLALAVSKQTS